VARSTLADASESHDRRIFADFAQVLIGIAWPPYAQDQIDNYSLSVSSSTYALRLSTGLARMQ
jgi:hypothetical protein